MAAQDLPRLARKIYRVPLGQVERYAELHAIPDEQVVQVDYHHERGWLIYTEPRTEPQQPSRKRWWRQR